MVPVIISGETTPEDQSQQDFKLVIHRTVHQLLEREEERPGWYGDPLSTAWVGLALQTHDGRQDDVADIAAELEDWYEDASVDHEFEVAALALMGRFFKEHDRGRPIYDRIQDQLFVKLDAVRERREASDGHTAPQFQYFDSAVYLYCALVGVTTYGRLDEYREFLDNEVAVQRHSTWIEYDRMAFVETVALEVAEYDADTCRSVLNKMRKVDVEALNEYEYIPLVWFFQEQQDTMRAALSDESFAQEMVDEIRRNLWQRVYEELPFELYLSEDIEYEFTPDVRQLALLDRLLGRLQNQIIVFSETQLDEHDAEVAREKEADIRVNRRRKLLGYLATSMLLVFIGIDSLISHPPSTPVTSVRIPVQGLITIELMMIVWVAEGLSKDSGLADRYQIVEDLIDIIENHQMAAWIIRAVFGGIIAWGIVSYYWPVLESFFTGF